MSADIAKLRARAFSKLAKSRLEVSLNAAEARELLGRHPNITSALFALAAGEHLAGTPMGFFARARSAFERLFDR